MAAELEVILEEEEEEQEAQREISPRVTRSGRQIGPAQTVRVKKKKNVGKKKKGKKRPPDTALPEVGDPDLTPADDNRARSLMIYDIDETGSLIKRPEYRAAGSRPRREPGGLFSRPEDFVDSSVPPPAKTNTPSRYVPAKSANLQPLDDDKAPDETFGQYLKRKLLGKPAPNPLIPPEGKTNRTQWPRPALEMRSLATEHQDPPVLRPAPVKPKIQPEPLDTPMGFSANASEDKTHMIMKTDSQEEEKTPGWMDIIKHGLGLDGSGPRTGARITDTTKGLNIPPPPPLPPAPVDTDLFTLKYRSEQERHLGTTRHKNLTPPATPGMRRATAPTSNLLQSMRAPADVPPMTTGAKDATGVKLPAPPADPQYGKGMMDERIRAEVQRRQEKLAPGEKLTLTDREREAMDPEEPMDQSHPPDNVVPAVPRQQGYVTPVEARSPLTQMDISGDNVSPRSPPPPMRDRFPTPQVPRREITDDESRRRLFDLERRTGYKFQSLLVPEEVDEPSELRPRETHTNPFAPGALQFGGKSSNPFKFAESTNLGPVAGRTVDALPEVPDDVVVFSEDKLPPGISALPYHKLSGYYEGHVIFPRRVLTDERVKNVGRRIAMGGPPITKEESQYLRDISEVPPEQLHLIHRRIMEGKSVDVDPFPENNHFLFSREEGGKINWNVGKKKDLNEYFERGRDLTGTFDPPPHFTKTQTKYQADLPPEVEGEEPVNEGSYKKRDDPAGNFFLQSIAGDGLSAEERRLLDSYNPENKLRYGQRELGLKMPEGKKDPLATDELEDMDARSVVSSHYHRLLNRERWSEGKPPDEKKFKRSKTGSSSGKIGGVDPILLSSLLAIRGMPKMHDASWLSNIAAVYDFS